MIETPVALRPGHRAATGRRHRTFATSGGPSAVAPSPPDVSPLQRWPYPNRAPWWCVTLAAILPLGFGVLMAVPSDSTYRPELVSTMGGMQFTFTLVLVVATVVSTGAWHLRTVPSPATRTPTRDLWARASQLGALSLVFGEVVAFVTYALAQLVAPAGSLALETFADWRMIGGHGVVHGLAAVIAVGVASLVREPAAAVSLLLVWTFGVENLLALLPGIGAELHRYLPFVNAALFAGDPDVAGVSEPLAPLASLGIFAATAVVILTAAIVALRRRNA